MRAASRDSKIPRAKKNELKAAANLAQRKYLELRKMRKAEQDKADAALALAREKQQALEDAKLKVGLTPKEKLAIVNVIKKLTTPETGKDGKPVKNAKAKGI